MITNAHLVAEYDIGQTVGASASFTIDDGATPIDPTTVTGWYRKPDGTTTQVLAGDITKIGAGLYTFAVITDQWGEWWYGFHGTGTATAANERRFMVRRSHE